MAARWFPTSGFEHLDPTGPVEEELLSGYEPEQFYPARIGEIFNGRYHAVCKIGYGTTSTVWLARDLQYAPPILLPR